MYNVLNILSPGNFIGGAEKYNLNLLRALEESNVRCQLLISHNFNFYEECISKRINCRWLGSSLLEAAKNLNEIIEHEKPSAIITNSYHSSYLIALYKILNFTRKNNPPKLIDIEHGWITTSIKENFKTILDKLCLRIYDNVVVVDPNMEESASHFVDSKKIVYIPSFINVNEEINYKQQDNMNKVFKILAVGRLSTEKRFDLLIKALTEVNNRSGGWQLILVGDGPERSRLENIAKLGGIHNKVIFTGQVDDVNKYYKESDLLVISSINEGLPLVALEAISYGVIVLSTSVGYLPVLLGSNRGFLVDKHISPLTLAENIIEIIGFNKEYKDSIRQNAYKYIYKNHNASRAVASYKRLVSKYHSNV